MMVTIVGMLALCVCIGILTLIWGARRFNLPSIVLVVAFALTAASWLAFLITAISFTAIRLATTSI